jgi:hypothetical protein
MYIRFLWHVLTVLTLGTLSDVIKIETILFVPCHPRCPRIVGLAESQGRVRDIFVKNLANVNCVISVIKV